MSQQYQSSRLTSGNLLFPDTISVHTDGVHYEKRGLFGSNEEVVNYRQIASVKVRNGIIWSTIQIETSGGSQPVVMKGLGKGDAKVLRESIQKMQQRS
jgi:hypothetical protein